MASERERLQKNTQVSDAEPFWCVDDAWKSLVGQREIHDLDVFGLR